MRAAIRRDRRRSTTIPSLQDRTCQYRFRRGRTGAAAGPRAATSAAPRGETSMPGAILPIRPTRAPLRGAGAGRGGDVDARLRVRVAEIGTSVSMISDWLGGSAGRGRWMGVAAAGDGAARGRLPSPKAFRGDVLVWLRLASGGRVARCPCAGRLRGSNGRCSKPRSRTTSSPTFRCATNRSTAPIQVTISRSCARSY